MFRLDIFDLTSRRLIWSGKSQGNLGFQQKSGKIDLGQGKRESWNLSRVVKDLNMNYLVRLFPELCENNPLWIFSLQYVGIQFAVLLRRLSKEK